MNINLRSYWLSAMAALLLLLMGHDMCGDSGAGSPPAPRSWPMFGGSIQRNLANTIDTHIPDSWSDEDGKQKNIKWVAERGCSPVAYSGPVVAGGRVFVSTNNDRPRDPKVKGDKGVLMCFRESDGQFLWQAVHDKLEDELRDWPKIGILSTPAIDANRVYYVSNRCELVCADVEGDPATKKAKIIWSLDMIKELQVSPTYIAISSPLLVGELVFVVTGNGADFDSKKGGQTVANPDAPSFLAVHKMTGKVVWQDSSPGPNILDGQWSSPAAAEVKGVTQVIFPGGDGWLYAFEAKTGKLIWKFDCNPKASKYHGGGSGDRNYLMAAPVIVDNKVYIGTGQQPENGNGVGHLWCIDMTREPKNKEKDLSPVDDNFDPKSPVNKDSGLVWHYGGLIEPRPENDRPYRFGRTTSTVAVHDGVVYAAETDGYLHCLDAKTGEHYWEHDLADTTWASPFYVDGKVFLGTDGGAMFVFPAGKVKKEPAKFEFETVRSPVVAANGVLYINAGAKLFAIAPDKK